MKRVPATDTPIRKVFTDVISQARSVQYIQSACSASWKNAGCFNAGFTLAASTFYLSCGRDKAINNHTRFVLCPKRGWVVPVGLLFELQFRLRSFEISTQVGFVNSQTPVFLLQAGQSEEQLFHLTLIAALLVLKLPVSQDCTTHLTEHIWYLVNTIKRSEAHDIRIWRSELRRFLQSWELAFLHTSYRLLSRQPPPPSSPTYIYEI